MTLRRLATALLFFVAAAVLCAGQGTGSLTITVTDMSGASIPRAQVRVVNRSEHSVLTDQNGNASVDGLLPGTYKVSAQGRGFRDTSASGIAVVAGVNREVLLKLEQKPPSFSEIHSYQTLEPNSYDKALKTFDEPALCQGKIEGHAQSYRFLWIPTFDHPVLMRIDIEDDGTATLLTKTLSGSGGYGWGHVQTGASRSLSIEEESTLFTTLADIGFWTLPASVKNPYLTVLDGTTWVIEGIREGDCHAVARHSSPLTDLFSHYFLGEVGKLQPYYQHGQP
jgi:hypothetical protein